MSEASVAVSERGGEEGEKGEAHESVMKHGEDGPSSRVQDAAAGPSPAGEESSAGTAGDQGGSFDCNICLELAQDPVVTLCGHLFCWPCLYRWLQMHSICQECPVCKASVEEEKVIPLYGRGKVNCVDPRTKAVPGLNIPHRPPGQRPETARQAEQYPAQGFNFMAGPAGPAATARFGLGFDGERRFPEPGSGFVTEPVIVFNDEGWLSTVRAFANLTVNEAPFVDAIEGPATGIEGVSVDGNEGPGSDANGVGGESFVNESPFVDANEGPPGNGIEGPAEDAQETDGPFEDANEGPSRNASAGAPENGESCVNEVPRGDAGEGLSVDSNKGSAADAGNEDESPFSVNEGPFVDVSEGPMDASQDSAEDADDHSVEVRENSSVGSSDTQPANANDGTSAH